MGSRMSVEVDSPQFDPKAWKYLPDPQDLSEDYGIFRTLENISTGQKIDEYEFIWENAEEFDYYLKSYNWRYKQPHVVNTKYIDLLQKDQFCSSSYMGRVYLEHVSVRMSDIYDIPYPDNLYVAIQALEGYSRIYQHSKFFYLEENQICVDEAGNLKIWVNGDLSINYPNIQGQELQNQGEEEMVDMLIKIVADNTDSDSEPEIKLIDYFQRKRGIRGKKFQEAKLLIQAYARINGVQIPTKFEAILSQDNKEVLELKSFAGNSRVLSVSSRPSSYQAQRPTLGLKDNSFSQNHNPIMAAHPKSAFNQNMSFGQEMRGKFNINFGQPAQTVIHNRSLVSINPYQQQWCIPPQYPRHNNINFQRTPQLPQPYYNSSLPCPKVQAYQVSPFTGAVRTLLETQGPSNFATKSSLDQEVNMENTEQKKKKNFISDSQEQRDKVFLQLSEFENRQHVAQDNQLSKTQNEEKRADKDMRAMIAKSLPIDPTLNKRSNKELESIVPHDKSVRSHISSKDYQFNSLKLQELIVSKKSEKNTRLRQPKHEKVSLKYYSTLEDELEMDPEIAADLAKYIS